MFALNVGIDWRDANDLWGWGLDVAPAIAVLHSISLQESSVDSIQQNVCVVITATVCMRSFSVYFRPNVALEFPLVSEILTSEAL